MSADQFKQEIRELNESAKKVGAMTVLEQALRRIEAMAPVILPDHEPLSPGELMAYRRAKRQAMTILASLVPPK